MTTVPAAGASTPGRPVQAAPARHSRDRRSSPIPTIGMIATRFMELRRRRGLMIAVLIVNIGLPALFLLIRLLLHAFAPRTNPPAGGQLIFLVLAASFLPTFGFITAIMVGCTAGYATSPKACSGTWWSLAGPGWRSTSARIPGGLAILVPLLAIGYTIVCAVFVFATPTSIDDSNVNLPPGLSRAGFKSSTASHAEPVICLLPYSGRVLGTPCAPVRPAGRSQRSPPPSRACQPGSSGRQDRQPGLPRLHQHSPPSADLPHDQGRAVDRASGDCRIRTRTRARVTDGAKNRPGDLAYRAPVHPDAHPFRARPPAPARSAALVVGVAMAHLEPSGLPGASALPGVTGGVGGPGHMQSLPESATQAVCVIIAWLAGWTILGAWRMMTRDA